MSRREDLRIESENVSVLLGQMDLLQEIKHTLAERTMPVLSRMMETRGISGIEMMTVDEDIDSRPVIDGTGTADRIDRLENGSVVVTWSDDYGSEQTNLAEIDNLFAIECILKCVYVIAQMYDDGMYYADDDGELQRTEC